MPMPYRPGAIRQGNTMRLLRAVLIEQAKFYLGRIVGIYCKVDTVIICNGA